ncbi:MAG: hypothetical protein D6797_01615, partial [Bdellovibrio sp.]
MSKVFKNISVQLDEHLEEKLRLLSPHFESYRILRKSIDARKKHKAPFYVYHVEVFEKGEPVPSRIPPP